MRTLVIKNFKGEIITTIHINTQSSLNPLINRSVKSHLPEDYAEKSWLRLQSAVKQILQNSQPQQSSLTFSMEQLYQLCENLCHSGMTDMIYQRLQDELRSFIMTEASILLDQR